MKVVEKEGILLLGAIKGLVSEGNAIRKSIEKFEGEFAAISISPEELKGLREYIKEGEFGIELYGYEEAYLTYLKEFGEVKAPAPSYVEAVKSADSVGIPIVPLDMDDDTFADVYIENVSRMEFISHMFRENRVKRKTFRVNSVEDFVLKWDAYINHAKGLRDVEKAREEYMAKKLAELGKKGRVIAIIDFERLDGVIKKMAKYL
jgi:pheromone shutdown protein TraB